MLKPIIIRINADNDSARASLDSVQQAMGRLDGATDRYRTRLSRLDAAERRGLITTRQKNVAVAEAERRYRAAAQSAASMTGAVINTQRAATNFGNHLRFTNQQILNIGQQLNQVGQQTAVTGDFFHALAVQIPDILQGFGSIASLGIGVAVGLSTALIPALFDTESRMEDLTDATEEFTGALDNLRTAQNNAILSPTEMREAFGAASSELKRTLEIMVFIEKNKAFETQRKSIEEMIDLFQTFRGTTQEVINLFGGDFFGASDAMRELRREAIGPFIRDLEKLQQSDLGFADQLAALMNMRQILLDNVDTQGKMSTQQQQVLEQLNTIIREMQRMQPLLDNSRDKMKNMTEAAIEQIEAMKNIREEAERAREIAERAQRAKDAELRRSLELLAALRDEANIKAIVAKYGEDSTQATEARIAAERRAFEATLDTRDISEELKLELLDAWDNARGIASEDMASNIAAAADEASRLAAMMAAAREERFLLASRPGLRGDLIDEDIAMGQGVLPDERSRTGQSRAIENFNRQLEAMNRSSGRGSSGRRRRGRGGSGRGQDEDRIGSLAQELATEREMLEVWREESLEKLDEFNQKELELLGGKQEAKLRLEQEYLEKLNEIQKREKETRIRTVQATYGAITGILNSFASMQDAQSKKSFERQKKLRTAAAIIEGIGAVQASYRRGAEIGGPFLAKLFAAQAALATVANVKAIQSQTFNGGGGIPGTAGGGGGGVPAGGGGGPGPMEVRFVNLRGTATGDAVANVLNDLQNEADDRGLPGLVFSRL